MKFQQPCLCGLEVQFSPDMRKAHSLSLVLAWSGMNLRIITHKQENKAMVDTLWP